MLVQMIELEEMIMVEVGDDILEAAVTVQGGFSNVTVNCTVC